MVDTPSANKLVQGVGYNDRSCPTKNYDGNTAKEYQLWLGMLERCYNKKSLEKSPTYIGCTLSDEFKQYHLFHAWCQKQVGFGLEDYQLDKDILAEGNKIYSAETCCFVPMVLNMLLLRKSEGKLPTGVSKSRNRFRARCNVNGIIKSLGTYDTIHEALSAYITFKEAHVKAQAEHFKPFIDIRVYNALMSYKFRS